MKRTFLASAAVTLGLAVLVPATALAAILELGSTSTPVSAPPPCSTTGTTTKCPGGVQPQSYFIILTRSTALETIRDSLAYPTKVTRAGRIVAFTVGLSRLDTNRTQARSEIHFLDQRYGGTTQAAVTVLAPVGPHNHFTWKVVAISEIKHLQPYLGQVVQFWLNTTLPVVPGDVVALTIPTWAPVLTINQSPKKFAYRQSRSANCNNPPAITQAQLTIGQSAKYGCNYPGTRVEYSATEVTDPVAVNPIHAGDVGGASSTVELGAK